MATPPDLTSWLTVFTMIEQLIPLLMRGIPVVFVTIGLIGVLWYSSKLIRLSSYKYDLPSLIKSLMLLSFGFFLSYIGSLF